MCKINFDFMAFWTLISIILNFCFPQYTLAASSDFSLIQEKNVEKTEENKKYPSVFQKNVLIQTNNPITAISKKTTNEAVLNPQISSRTIPVIVTAYSSTVDQCDSTPFLTASGARVHDGTLAANFLRFGTKVKFPTIYGEKIFIVEDRMKPSVSRKVDLWFPARNEAIIFGVKKTEMLILDF